MQDSPNLVNALAPHARDFDPDQAVRSEAGGRPAREYHINLFWIEEDRSWTADIPDLESCSAFGATPGEALREVLLAKEGWLESARAHGDHIPEPRYRPAIYAAR